jgi:hypothetical protein
MNRGFLVHGFFHSVTQPSFGAACAFASRRLFRRSRSDAACFSRRAFRFTFFFASISFRLELPADFVFVVAMSWSFWVHYQKPALYSQT